jgi:hypothetical protein
MNEIPTPSLPPGLLWLADAPAFIDTDQVARFHDAVVRPPTKQGTTTYKVSKEQIDKLNAKLSGKGSFTFNKLLEWVGIGSPSVEISGGIEGQQDKSNSEGFDVVLYPIDTPQRQLEQLTVHYLLTHPDRLFLIDELVEGEWCRPKVIDRIPRALAFLNLPSLEEAQATHIAETTLVPIAAEFANGIVETFFDKIMKNKEKLYPDLKEPSHVSRRRDYWSWFWDNFKIGKGVDLIEAAAKRQKSRIQWIDFRVPVGTAGESLHLHISPAGKYDTGTFAYNFVRRGYEHGLRLVGSLKSDPDMNVLAIYER